MMLGLLFVGLVVSRINALFRHSYAICYLSSHRIYPFSISNLLCEAEREGRNQTNASPLNYEVVTNKEIITL